MYFQQIPTTTVKTKTTTSKTRGTDSKTLESKRKENYKNYTKQCIYTDPTYVPKHLCLEKETIFLSNKKEDKQIKMTHAKIILLLQSTIFLNKANEERNNRNLKQNKRIRNRFHKKLN